MARSRGQIDYTTQPDWGTMPLLGLIGFPLGFAALVAVPALGAIYWLRSKFRRQPVSSLMLWADQKRARQGGRKLQRVQTPLLFYLELATLGLLIVAAIKPLVETGLRQRELFVVLDDSWSMLAGDPDSPQRRARAALETELGKTPRLSCRLIRAGTRPQMLGEVARTLGSVRNQLENWHCQSPQADLMAAIALARELGGDDAQLLVLTDRDPGHDLEEGDTQWWSFGQIRPNIAIVNAARSWKQQQQRALVEVENFSDRAVNTDLIMQLGNTNPTQQRRSLALAPGERYHLVVDLEDLAEPLTLSLPDDALSVDNRVILLNDRPKPVRVAIDMRDEKLREKMTRALEVTGRMNQVMIRPQLRVTDRVEDVTPIELQSLADADTRRDGSSTWTLQITQPQETQPYIGPFILDKAHPLCDGLPLEGIIWSAAAGAALPGRPIIMAGNVPLLTVEEALSGSRTLHLQLNMEQSNLTEAVAWPVLAWNLLTWYNQWVPGVSRPNVRAGDNVAILAEFEQPKVTWRLPDGRTRELTLTDPSLSLAADLPGVHEVQTDRGIYSFAVNVLLPDESNLQTAATGQWGSWLDEATLRRDYRNLTGLLILIALILLLLHMALIARSADDVPAALRESPA